MNIMYFILVEYNSYIVKKYNTNKKTKLYFDKIMMKVQIMVGQHINVFPTCSSYKIQNSTFTIVQTAFLPFYKFDRSIINLLFHPSPRIKIHSIQFRSRFNLFILLGYG